MDQINIDQINTNQPKNGCALTGHRIIQKDFSLTRLKDIFTELIYKQDITTFYCGMAMGFDLTACELLLEMKKNFPPMKVIACIPCPEQSSMFSFALRKKYDELLARCDERVVLSSHYTPACMHVRNHYMVDNAKILVAYCNRDKGGTASTVAYAKKKGLPVIFV